MLLRILNVNLYNLCARLTLAVLEYGRWISSLEKRDKNAVILRWTRCLKSVNFGLVPLGRTKSSIGMAWK